MFTPLRRASVTVINEGIAVDHRENHKAIRARDAASNERIVRCATPRRIQMSHLINLAVLSGALVFSPRVPAQAATHAVAFPSEPAPVGHRLVLADGSDIGFQRVDRWDRGYHRGYGRGGGPRWGGYYGGGDRGWGRGYGWRAPRWGYPAYQYHPPVYVAPSAPFYPPPIYYGY